jgi:hypothetical protein
MKKNGLLKLSPDRRWALAALAVSVFVFHLATLLDYPAPSCDETFYSRTALRYTQALATGETWPPRGALFFAPHGRSYWLLLSSAFALLGQSLFTARLVSLLGLAALAAATYLVGRLYVSRPVGLWAASLISLAWLSLYAGHFARPDILAAAANTATLGLLHLATARRRGSLYLALGLAASLQMDLHLNLLHFLLPTILVALFQIYRNRAWPHFVALSLGLVIGGGIFAAVHLGNAVGQFTGGVSASPSGLLNSYTGFSTQNLLAGTLIALVDQWWKYYLWFAPFLSLPQAALFMLGLGYAPFSRDRNLLTLFFIALLANLTFAAVNQRYQLLGYSLHWLPLYLVLGVAALERLTANLNWRGVRPATLALLGLAALYLAGDIRLTSAQLGETYRRDARVLFEDVPPGSRVLTASYWWLEMRDTVVLIDEYQLMPFNTILWWNGLPELTTAQAQALAGERLIEEDEVRDRILALKPNYVIDDTVIGCLSDQEETARGLTDYVAQHCILIQVYKSAFANRLQPIERPQSVYTCPAP